MKLQHFLFADLSQRSEEAVETLRNKGINFIELRVGVNAIIDKG